MLTEKTFPTGELTINYAEGPDNGPPLVVLHDVTQRWQEMYQLITGLTPDWQVFACDLRGHGKSGRAALYRAIDYFTDTATFIANQVGSPVVLLGASGGAMACLGAAGQVPGLVQAVVLLDPPFYNRDPEYKVETILEFWKGVVKIQAGRRSVQEAFGSWMAPADFARFDEMLKQVDPKILQQLQAGRYFEGLDLEKVLKNVKCPVLLLYGNQDRGGLVRESDLEFFQTHVRNGKAVLIAEGGHFLSSDSPARVLVEVGLWMKELGLDRDSR